SPRSTSLRATSDCLLQNRKVAVLVSEPALLQLRERPVRLQLLDRPVDEGLQRAALLHHRAVALAGDDLSDDTAVGALLLVGLRHDDGHVVDERLAATGLDRVEDGGGR